MAEPLSPIRRFQLLHLVSVVALAALALLTFGLLGYFVSGLLADPAEVNLAGRQRMHAEQVSLQAAMILARPEDKVGFGRRLSSALDTMEHEHDALINGDAALGVHGLYNLELRKHYLSAPFDMDARVKEFVILGRDLVSAVEEGRPVEAKVAAILNAESVLVPRLNDAVNAHLRVAESNLAWVQWVIAALFLLTVGTLGLVWFAVLRPAVSFMRKEHYRMTKAEGHQREEASLQAFGRELSSALEMVDDEADLLKVVALASTHLGEDAPTEVLLADSSQSHVRQGMVHPTAGAPGCGVETPWQCVAIRRGRTATFESNAALDACPRLRERGERCSAVCMPLTFMGETMGVVHTTRPEGQLPTADVLNRMERLAAVSAARLSAIRSFDQVQQQAATDPLTGLLNRRALEEQVRQLQGQGHSMAVAIADLDHFKRLNDTYGHDAGDRALVTFAKSVQDAVRPADVVARFGGEEFIIVFRNANAAQAAKVLDRVRGHLAKVVAGADTPTFTASYGVSDDRLGPDLGLLIQVADTALLRAKELGRDCVVVADMGEPDAIPEEHAA
ncbi:MAG: diguanylate cyclase [Myxococcota bacterium]